MKRRDFILSGTAGMAAISIPSYWYFRDIEYDPLLAQPASLSLIWDAGEIRDLGNKYRMLNPGENRANWLVERLAEGIGAERVSIESLEDKVKSDFETGQTVKVDGWILSVTEARQCALASTLELK